MSEKRLYLIDATAFCYRAFYALRGLSTSFGQPTNAVYGFVNMLKKILKEKKPQYLGVCFDVSRQTFRQKRFADYKIQRPPMPDALSSQIPLIKQIVSAYGIALLEKEGYEADDIIATMAKKAKEKRFSVTVVSSDKDILQLVDEDTVVFSPYKDEGTLYDTQKVQERYGVKPHKIADIIALMGDSVDNIPGVAGVGEKTAVDLIKEFGSLESLLSKIDRIKSPKLKESIQQSIDKIKLNKELASLDADIDLDSGLEDVSVGNPDFKELFRLFKYLEFNSLLKELPADGERPQEIKPVEVGDKFLKSISGERTPLILYGDIQEMAFGIKDKIFKMPNTSQAMRDILADPNIPKIGYDLKKIKVSFAKENINLQGLHFDAMIAAYLLNPSLPEYGLLNICWDYLPDVRADKNIDNYRAVSLVATLTPVLEKELEAKSLHGLFHSLEMPLTDVLAEMELNGIKLDTTLLALLSKEIEKRLIKLIEEIYDLSQTQFNINSPKQLRDILFERLKLPVIKKSKTGPSTDEEVLRQLAPKHKLPALLLEYRQLTKLKNTYIDVLPNLIDKKTGRVHTSFNQTATETGRLSSSNPNLQNIPIKTDIGKKIRQAIIASDKDSYLLSCDYSQVELRILTHLCRDENLTAAFLEGKDIHRITASLIYGLDEKDVSEAMREVAKRVNFGIIYGLTSYGLSKDLGVTQEEAQGFIDAYFVRYPKVKEYIDAQIKRAQKDGFVTTVLGRRRYIPEINNKNQAIRQFAQRQAVNTPIQGSASDLIKLAMVNIQRDIREKGFAAKMILQIHDELVFDVPNKELDAIVALVKERMENVLKLQVPVKVDTKKGKNWLEMEEVK